MESLGEALGEIRHKLGIGLIVTGILLIPYGKYHDYFMDDKNPIQRKHNSIRLSDSLATHRFFEGIDSMYK